MIECNVSARYLLSTRKLALECDFEEKVMEGRIMTTTNWQSLFCAAAIVVAFANSLEKGIASGSTNELTIQQRERSGAAKGKFLLALDNSVPQISAKEPGAAQPAAPLHGTSAPAPSTVSPPLAVDLAAPPHTSLSGGVSQTGSAVELKEEALMGEIDSVVKRFTEGWRNFLQNPCNTSVTTTGPALFPSGHMFWTFP